MTEIVAHTTTLEATVPVWSGGYAVEVAVSVKVFSGPVAAGTAVLMQVVNLLTAASAKGLHSAG